jgi:hypothetical protein
MTHLLCAFAPLRDPLSIVSRKGAKTQRNKPEPTSELLLYTDDNGAVRLHVRLVDATVWLSQALLAQLFGKDIRTISEHLRNIFDEGELDREATIRRFRRVRTDGSRGISREEAHLGNPRRSVAADGGSDDEGAA